jgi:hypothetical protein
METMPTKTTSAAMRACHPMVRATAPASVPRNTATTTVGPVVPVNRPHSPAARPKESGSMPSGPRKANRFGVSERVQPMTTSPKATRKSARVEVDRGSNQKRCHAAAVLRSNAVITPAPRRT